MKLTYLLPCAGKFAVVACVMFAAGTLRAQTVIGNETLATTTFAVGKDTKVAKCGKAQCRAVTALLDPIPVSCPGTAGQTCTIHISLDAKITTVEVCNCGSPNKVLFQFFVDDAAPSIGPTNSNGDYLVAEGVWSAAPDTQSYPTSVIATVTNTDSSDHKIAVNLGCEAVSRSSRGCRVSAKFYTMRVDVFRP